MDFHSTWTNRRRIRLSFRARLISSRGIPRRAGEEHPCRSGRPTGHTRAPRPYVTSVPAGSVRRDPREAISSIYRQRLHGSFAKAPLAPWTRGFRRARHFTYVAECPRANISSANVTLLDTLGGYPCCGFRLPKLVLSSLVYRIPRVFDTRAASLLADVGPAPLNRKAAY